jgi:hypothetical protein
MRAVEYVADNADDLQRFGLDDPQLAIAFTVQPAATQPVIQPSAPIAVKFGRYKDLRKENVFVQAGSAAPVASIAARSMTTFDKKPLDLRDKNVVKIASRLTSRGPPSLPPNPR